MSAKLLRAMLVVGQRDLEAGAVSIRLHGKGNAGTRLRVEAIAGILESIKARAGGLTLPMEFPLTVAGKSFKV